MRQLRRDVLEACERAQLHGDWLHESQLSCPLELAELRQAWHEGLTICQGCVEHRLTDRGRRALLRARSG